MRKIDYCRYDGERACFGQECTACLSAGMHQNLVWAGDITAKVLCATITGNKLNRRDVKEFVNEVRDNLTLIQKDLYLLERLA